MAYFDDWIATACSDLGGVDVVRLDRQQSIKIVEEVTLKYGRWRTYGDLIERIYADCRIREPDGWRKIADYDYAGDVLLFVEPTFARSVYKFESIKLLSEILGECPDFNWYVVDECYDFLLAQGDHDMLVGAGKASAWVARVGRDSGKSVRIFVAGI